MRRPGRGYGWSSGGHPDVRMAGSIKIRVLRLENATGKRDRAAPGAAETQDKSAVRIQQRRVRVPADSRGPGARRRAVLPRAGPRPHARAGPGTVPAPPVAALADRAGPGRADTGPGQPRFLRSRARRENGRRYHIYPDLGRV